MSQLLNKDKKFIGTYLSGTDYVDFSDDIRQIRLTSVTSHVELRPGDVIYANDIGAPQLVTWVDEQYAIDRDGQYVYTQIWGREMTRLELLVKRMIKHDPGE